MGIIEKMKKIKVSISEEERILLTRLLIEYKNELHRIGRYTDAIDDLLLKVVG